MCQSTIENKKKELERKRNINRKAKFALMEELGMNSFEAEEVLISIITGKIPNVRLHYEKNEGLKNDKKNNK